MARIYKRTTQLLEANAILRRIGISLEQTSTYEIEVLGLTDAKDLPIQAVLKACHVRGRGKDGNIKKLRAWSLDAAGTEATDQDMAETVMEWVVKLVA